MFVSSEFLYMSFLWNITISIDGINYFVCDKNIVSSRVAIAKIVFAYMLIMRIILPFSWPLIYTRIVLGFT